MANEQYPYSDLPEFTEANEDKNKITPLWANTYIRNTLNALKDELGSGPRGTAADLTTRLDLEHAGDGSHSLSLVLSENDIPDLPAYLKVNGTDHMEGNLDMRSYSLVGTSYKVAIGWNALEGTSYRTKIGTKENPPILPAMTTAERDALPAANGLVIYNTTENRCEEYGDGSWGAFGEAGSGHELLSATHTDTAASAVSRGSIIVGDSTPEWAELAVGGAGTYLKADGADAAWGALGDHDHTGDAGDGGQLDHGAALAGLADDDHSQYLLATGTRAGASGQAQGFGANGIACDVIAESTGAAGVTIDTVLIKDGNVDGVDVSALASRYNTGNICLPASAWWPCTTSGCSALTQTEYATNKQNIQSLDFDTGSDEFAATTLFMPADWNGGTITGVPYWTAAGGSSAQTVCWALQGRAYANDDAVDQARGTAQASTDTWLANGDTHIGPATSAITLAGSPAALQMVHLRCYRDVSEDDMSGDAKLLGWMITYTRA
uniref:Tail protein n=1 Tax=viral metagenome TaxID=1070528 RepID=A0A6M3IXU6_9ZZZZ